jgi:hypothetical protein
MPRMPTKSRAPVKPDFRDEAAQLHALSADNIFSFLFEPPHQGLDTRAVDVHHARFQSAHFSHQR